jgi:hypothetical protein
MSAFAAAEPPFFSLEGCATCCDGRALDPNWHPLKNAGGYRTTGGMVIFAINNLFYNL